MRVLPDGENRYRLTGEDGRELGWIRGRAVRFLGFASADHVMAVAQRAWHALQAVLRREGAAQRRETGVLGALRLVHDGAYEWISDGRIPVARLHRPTRVGRQASFAIELVVPSNASHRLPIAAARAIADAVEPARVSMPRDAADLAHYIP